MWIESTTHRDVGMRASCDRTAVGECCAFGVQADRCYRIRAMNPTLPVLLGDVWLRFPAKLQRTFVTLRS
jgi:hypothetical protein